MWIQARYNPILNADGRPRKVVKIASNIWRQVALEREGHERLKEGRRSRDARRRKFFALRPQQKGFTSQEEQQP